MVIFFQNQMVYILIKQEQKQIMNNNNLSEPKFAKIKLAQGIKTSHTYISDTQKQNWPDPIKDQKQYSTPISWNYQPTEEIEFYPQALTHVGNPLHMKLDQPSYQRLQTPLTQFGINGQTSPSRQGLTLKTSPKMSPVDRPRPEYTYNPPQSHAHNTNTSTGDASAGYKYQTTGGGGRLSPNTSKRFDFTADTRDSTSSGVLGKSTIIPSNKYSILYSMSQEVHVRSFRI